MKSNQYPPSLPVFFLTELWERYGFYVIQTLLALYLALHFNWPDKKVYALVGSFTALTYLSPFVGGWIADKFIGQKNAVLLGAIILFISYIILGFSNHIPSLIKALASIAIGTGLLKPNISSLLGNQFTENSLQRENGYTIFYLGITTGIILGSTVPSIFKNILGWQFAFLSAAVGMVFSIILFSAGVLKYNVLDYNPRKIRIRDMLYTSLILTVFWPLCGHILLHPEFANIIFPSISLAAIIFMFHSAIREEKNQAYQTLAILCLCIISVMFWAFYFQMFLSLVLFISRLVNPKFMGILFPPPYYVAVESIGMILIGMLITKIKPKGNNLKAQAKSIANKFTLSMFCMSITYLLILGISYYSPSNYLISPLLLIPAYLIISLAELLLSPVGIAAVTILASREKVSTMMGIFFVSLGLGAYLSGKLANLTAIPENITNMETIKNLYYIGFSKLFLILVGCLIVTLILRYIIRHLMHKIAIE